MADTYEKNLNAASAIASGEYIRTINSNNESEKIDYAKLAKAIIEQYNSSTLAGSAQTLQSAINSLNSKLGDLASWTDLDTVISAGHYQLLGGSSYVNSPTSYGVLEVICPRRSGNLILIQRITTLSVIFVRYRDSDGSWKAWKKITMDAV